jgi:hypothetical protein
MELVFGVKLDQRSARAFMSKHLAFLNFASKMATDASLNLVLVHWPLPHLPGIYDRFEGRFKLDGSATYIDNLALVDRAVGDLRDAMEASFLWERTIVLITSDHSYRPELWGPVATPDGIINIRGNGDQPIPFLLKLAGQKKPVRFDMPFNAVLTHDLFLDLLSGKISDPDEVVDWLTQRASRRPYISKLPSKVTVAP